MPTTENCYYISLPSIDFCAIVPADEKAGCIGVQPAIVRVEALLFTLSDFCVVAGPTDWINGVALRACLNHKEQSMFEIFRSSDNQFVWRLKGNNGETLCHSETYTTKAAAQAGIAAVKLVAPNATVYDRT